MKNKKDPFEYYTTPKSGWEVMRWATYDRIRLERYINTLNLSFWEERKLFVKYFVNYLVPFVVIRVLLLWLLIIALLSLFDLPNIIPAQYWEVEFLDGWKAQSGFINHFSYCVTKQFLVFVISLLMSLGLGLVAGLGLSLVLGFSFGFNVVIVLGLVGGLVGGLVLGSVGGLIERLIFHMGLGLGLGLGLGVGLGLTPNLFFFGSALALSFIRGTDHLYSLNIGVSLTSYIVYVYYFTKEFFSNLENSPYIKYGHIDISLLAEKKIINKVKANLDQGNKFALFLYTSGHNSNLACLLFHVIHAERWKAAALNLNEDMLHFPQIGNKRFSEPATWIAQLNVVRSALITAEKENQISIKKSLFEDFVVELDKMYQLTENQFPKPTGFRDWFSVSRGINWYEYYRTALVEWKHIAAQKSEQIANQARLMEPITPNIFKTGDKLLKHDQAVFIERTQLKDHLSRVLYTTKGFSVIFLQGQRRVGKTSLLTFLPDILGRRFEVVYLDLQGNTADIPDFLKKLRAAIQLKFQPVGAPDWEMPDNWSEALHQIYDYCAGFAAEKQVRIILAIDEYEELHRHLQKDAAIGGDFLGTFRHLSQKQAEISIMWMGLRFFSELQQPNWGDYFVNAIPIQVPYLNRQESFQLIEVSTLLFDTGVKEAIFEDTQRHPALIQKICFGIVDIANDETRRNISMDDYKRALKDMIYITVNGVTDIFFNTTCETDVDKAIVWAILENKAIPREHKHRLRRLIEYGFVLENEGQYSLRVPIFKKWMEDFAQYYTL